MQKVVHKANGRGVAEHGWLHSRFSFSFAEWYEPSRMGFGALRVINDDVIEPSNGFGMHPHKNMEIITIVTGGVVSHADSMGNTFDVPAGDVQVMSAGTGVVHAEENHSKVTNLSLFQIWIQPQEQNSTPQYRQKSFDLVPKSNEFEVLVGPLNSDAPLHINQQAYISRALVPKGRALGYVVKQVNNGVYVFVVHGNLEVVGEVLWDRDAIGITDTQLIVLEAKEDTTVLVFEVPMSV